MSKRIHGRVATVAGRLLITVVIVAWGFSFCERVYGVEPVKPTSIDGVYNGSYAGDRGQVNFKLTLTQEGNGTLGGAFTIYVSDGADTKAYTCDVRGRYIPANRMVVVMRGKWETPPPRGIDMPGLNGVFDPDGGKGAGQISGQVRMRPSPKFEAVRDADESAKLAAANANKKAAEPPPAVATAANRGGSTPAAAAPAKPTSRPPGQYLRRSEVDGVYTGTYGSNPDDKVAARLYVKFIDNGSVNGILDGLFTIDVPPAADAKPITYTYKLAGTNEVGTLRFYSAKAIGPAAPDAYAVKQLTAEFVKTPPVKVGDRQYAYDYDPDQISGRVIGNDVRRSFNKIEAKRDKEESAQVAKLMAAQADAAGKAEASTTATTAAPAATAVRPSIVGVFNGTYTRADEQPTKFKLSVTQAPYTGGAKGIISLAGLATIYLPVDSGTKAYTYSLKGTLDGNGKFHLFANEWETIPPKDFKDFRGMGFTGTFFSNVNQNSARISSAEESGPNAQFFLPKFEAKWDAAESADIRSTIAGQKKVGDTDQAAALKEQAEAIKNAKPKQLASKDLIRKSQAYWDKYGGDLIREIFDGGFATAIDEEPTFQQMFTSYVELYSEKCSAFLPADHKTVTITTTTTFRGAVVSTSTRTLEIDSRFVDKYAEFIGIAPAPGSDKEKEQTAKTLAIAGRMLLNRGGPSHGTSPADAAVLLRRFTARGLGGARDMDKFFETEVRANGPTAAMRQMGENLLRAATGEPSLQEAGAKIDGAEAETDKDLPPGRFARFIDGANAYYRARAKADPIRYGDRLSHNAAFCEILAAKYQNVMTREEEYYYANDFENRFANQIMQPRQSSGDPAWPRLHPAVEKTIEELK
jgi:hypothetical protein